MAEKTLTLITINSKNWLRHYGLIKRKTLSARYRKQSSQKIVKKLVHSRTYLKSKVVGTTLSFGSEVDTWELIKHAWAQKKTVVVPFMNQGLSNPQFVIYQRGDRLRPSKFGPLQPVLSKRAFPVKKIKLNIVPGLCFDKWGYRLGYGGGFYDRVIHKIPSCFHVGLFFANQEIPHVPCQKRDQRLSLVMTEQDVFTP